MESNKTEENDAEFTHRENSIRKFLDVYQDRPPEILYHYCSIQGLQGIAESREIWASDIHYLNDTSEFVHAMKLAYEELQKRQESASEIVKAALEEMLFQLNRLTEYTIFVASFSEESDLLSQWRSYCPIRGGFSIGLEPDSILACERFCSDVILRKCIYGEVEQKNLIRAVVDWSIGEVPDEVKEDPAYWLKTWAQNVSVWFYKIMALTAPILKHPTFYEEKEWRLIMLPHDLSLPIRFRAGETMMIPYVAPPLTIEGREFAFKHVVIGPTAEPKLSGESLMRYLTSLEFDGCRVSYSHTPYRNW